MSGRPTKVVGTISVIGQDGRVMSIEKVNMSLTRSLKIVRAKDTYEYRLG